jgi:hypothetical protein
MAAASIVAAVMLLRALLLPSGLQFNVWPLNMC